MEKYKNRSIAGKVLAHELDVYKDRSDVIVLALPRGGVPVAFEIAQALHAPLDVFIVRKLGVPQHSELAMGAIAMGDTCVFNDDIITELHISKAAIASVIADEKKELNRREVAYRGNYTFPSLHDKTVILVDDGIATGATIRAAVKALKQLKPTNIVIAVPVADKTMCDHLQLLADRLVCPMRPLYFYAVGAWYEDFSQTEDEEVYNLLNEARIVNMNRAKFIIDVEHPLIIPSADAALDGILYVPKAASGLVIFAHGSGSSRFSSRNQYVAKELQRLKLATLLFDLLTPDEDMIDTKTAQYRFDIDFLARRLVDATNWIVSHPVLNTLPVGYFGASTGGGAALVAAATLPSLIRAVVSRGGRPDLAGESLSFVEAPTMLIVGGHDKTVIELNQQAYAILHCKKKLEIVPGATHLFEEPGKLEAVSRLASEWFKQYLL